MSDNKSTMWDAIPTLPNPSVPAGVCDKCFDAQSDKARLDWLADPENSIGNVQLPTECVMNNLHDMRAAIDEAMQIDQKTRVESSGEDNGETSNGA